MSKNGWFEKLYLERFKKDNTSSFLIIAEVNSILIEFLKLQDLTNHLIKPCVLDLKMGGNINPEKEVSQMMKMGSSTSLNLGFRICGLFVLNLLN